MLKTFEEIYKEHKKQLRYLNYPNKKILICFAAVPASGKTTIAKILENKYMAVRINVDDVARIISKKFKPKPDFISVEEYKFMLKLYLLWFLETYKYPNKLIILDGSVDRKYAEVWLLAKQMGFNIFLIDIDTKKKVLIKRIEQRNKKTNLDYLKRLKTWKQDHNLFMKRWHADIVIRNEGKLELNELYNRLDKKLMK